MRLSKIFNNINKNQDKHFKNLKLIASAVNPMTFFLQSMEKNMMAIIILMRRLKMEQKQ